MMRRLCGCPIAISVGLVAVACISRTPLVSGEPEQLNSIKAEDIGTKVPIVGRLGKPIGTLMSLRGEWHASDSEPKPTGPRFHVTHVNGKRLETDVVYSASVVRAENLKNQTHHKAAGVVWEMRAFEDGRFVNLREQNWEEFYPHGAPQPANYEQGPFVCFLIGNVKKESGAVTKDVSSNSK